MNNIKIWKTVEVGALPKGDLLSELEKNGHYVSSYTKDLIEKMPLGKIEKIDLCKMTFKEMGFMSPPTWTQILGRVKELGDVCPPEVGTLLRIEDTDQPKGSWYYIAMEPIADSVGDPHVFCVYRYDDGESWLRALWVGPGSRWNLGGELVFRLRKSSDTQHLSSETLNLASLEKRVAELEAWKAKVQENITK